MTDTFIERSTLGGTVAFDRRTESIEALYQWIGSSKGLGYEFDIVTECRLVETKLSGRPTPLVQWHFTAWLPVDRAEIREAIANIEHQQACRRAEGADGQTSGTASPSAPGSSSEGGAATREDAGPVAEVVAAEPSGGCDTPPSGFIDHGFPTGVD